MVEHADLIDTQLLHEPKGIKESLAGSVYVSTVTDPAAGPWSGEWRKLKVEDLALTAQELSTPTYQPQASPVTLTSSIIAETTGSITNPTSWAETGKNDQELYLAINNLLTRLATLEDTVSKLQTLTGSISSGLKTLELFQEEE